MFDSIEYYLNPINLARKIIEFALRKDVLQTVILYLAADYVRLNGFFEEYLGSFSYDVYVLEDHIVDLSGFSLCDNAIFVLIFAVFLESYRDRLPSSLPHFVAEILSPALIIASLWALSGNVVFAFSVGVLKHIAGKGHIQFLGFIEASNQPIFNVPF